VQRVAADIATTGHSALDQTLVCFVLVDQQSQHAFCSRYDLGPWPLLRNVKELPPTAAQVGALGWGRREHTTNQP
jgi:hypothetical protein